MSVKQIPIPGTGTIFPRSEYEKRQERVLDAVERAGLDGIMVTARSHLRYLTGIPAKGLILGRSRSSYHRGARQPLSSGSSTRGMSGQIAVSTRSWPSPRDMSGVRFALMFCGDMALATSELAWSSNAGAYPRPT